MNQDFKEWMKVVCLDSKYFISHYYKVMKSSRSQLPYLYLKNAVLLYDGNCITGFERIEKFLIDLPSKNHNILTINAQPLVMDGSSTIEKCSNMLVQVFGTFESTDTDVYSFDQTLILEKRGTNWKIENDTVRVIEKVVSPIAPFCSGLNGIDSISDNSIHTEKSPEKSSLNQYEEVMDVDIPLDDNQLDLETMIEFKQEENDK